VYEQNRLIESFWILILLPLKQTKFADPDLVLGKGQFSIVLKGKILNDDVAVKIPKRSTSAKTPILQQLKEIEIMKTLSGHQNVLGILGISTKLVSKGFIYQFLEICPLGSVHNFLKENRNRFISLVHDDELQITHKKAKSMDALSAIGSSNEDFTTKTLISWTYQVCEGMEYIASNNVSKI